MRTIDIIEQLHRYGASLSGGADGPVAGVAIGALMNTAAERMTQLRRQLRYLELALEKDPDEAR
jgi:hypothetical protein